MIWLTLSHASQYTEPSYVCLLRAYVAAYQCLCWLVNFSVKQGNKFLVMGCAAGVLVVYIIEGGIDSSIREVDGCLKSQERSRRVDPQSRREYGCGNQHGWDGLVWAVAQGSQQGSKTCCCGDTMSMIEWGQISELNKRDICGQPPQVCIKASYLMSQKSF